MALRIPGKYGNTYRYAAAMATIGYECGLEAKMRVLGMLVMPASPSVGTSGRYLVRSASVTAIG